MTPTLILLSNSAAAVGLIHTAIGVDHYLPFIVMGRAQGWPLRKSMMLTFLCGLAHVSSSVILGLGGIWFGVTLQRLKVIHDVQGNLAAWFLILFGLTYAAWSIAKTRRMQRHMHEHADGHVHSHLPIESDELDETHKKAIMTTWTLFVIFVLGPCEPLVPLMIVPALQHGVQTAMWVAAVFSATTISCMLTLVVLGWYGLNMIPLRRFEMHANTLAGLAIAAAGAAIKLFGI